MPFGLGPNAWNLLEIFGWMKAVGGLRRSRFVGSVKTQLAAYMMGRLQPAPNGEARPEYGVAA